MGVRRRGDGINFIKVVFCDIRQDYAIVTNCAYT